MEGLEIHPVLTRIVCLNQPHLKPWWITQGLSMKLECLYNPHQPQVIWQEIPLRLPTPRILRIKGHASHALPSAESPSINVDVQMGTYLMFYIPQTNPVWSTCQLILNGIQSVSENTENPSSFSIHLNQARDETHNQRVKASANSNAVPGPSSYGGDDGRETRGDAPDWGGTPGTASAHVVTEDFRSSLRFTTIAEEEDPVPSDHDSDSSEDIHKLVIHRMVVDLRPLMTEWQKMKHDNILVLSLKPQEKGQAWQFISSWISVKEKSSEEVSASTLTRRKGVTKSKPNQPNAATSHIQTPTKPFIQTTLLR